MVFWLTKNLAKCKQPRHWRFWNSAHWWGLLVFFMSGLKGWQCPTIFFPKFVHVFLSLECFPKHQQSQALFTMINISYWKNKFWWCFDWQKTLLNVNNQDTEDSETVLIGEASWCFLCQDWRGDNVLQSSFLNLYMFFSLWNAFLNTSNHKRYLPW